MDRAVALLSLHATEHVQIFIRRLSLGLDQGTQQHLISTTFGNVTRLWNGVRIGMDVMLSDSRHWLEYDSVALAVLLAGMGFVELIALSI